MEGPTKRASQEENEKENEGEEPSTVENAAECYICGFAYTAVRRKCAGCVDECIVCCAYGGALCAAEPTHHPDGDEDGAGVCCDCR